MRNLSILAFIGFSIIFSGCGTIRTAALAIHHDTCVTSYNMFVCATPAKATPKAALVKTVCHSASAFMVKAKRTTKVLSRSYGQCKEQRKHLDDKVRQVGPGVKCTWKAGQIKCASSAGLVLAMLVLLLARIVRRRMLCAARISELKAIMAEGQGTVGVTTKVNRFIATIVIMMAVALPMAHTPVNAAITCQKAVRLIEAKEKVMPAFALVLLENCKVQAEGSVKDLWNRSTILERAAKRIIASAERYCEDSSVRGAGVVECFDQVGELAEIAEAKSLEASNLWLAAREQADAQQKAKAKAQQQKEIEALLEGGDKQVKEVKELIKAMEGLVVQEGSCGGFIIVLLYGLLGMLGECRSKLLMVLIALGCMTSVADAAAKNGCSLDSDENIIELFTNSCSGEVLQSLIEEEGLICTEGHRMEAASLSMSSPTEQGLSQEADLRLRFLEALCWSAATNSVTIKD